MPLRFKCPTCGGQLQTPETMAGQRGACHFCGARIIAPKTSGEAAALATPDPPRFGAVPVAPPPQKLDYAPFGKRALALVADTAVLWLLTLVLGPIFRALNPWPMPDLNRLLMDLTAISEGMSPDIGGALPDVTSLVLGLGFMLTWTSTVHWLYFALFESSTLQATPGKRLVSVRVTDTRGERIGFGQATMREVGRGFSSMLCFLGYLAAAFTEKRQALHDLLAQTLVLNR